MCDSLWAATRTTRRRRKNNNQKTDRLESHSRWWVWDSDFMESNLQNKMAPAGMIPVYFRPKTPQISWLLNVSAAIGWYKKNRIISTVPSESCFGLFRQPAWGFYHHQFPPPYSVIFEKYGSSGNLPQIVKEISNKYSNKKKQQHVIRDPIPSSKTSRHPLWVPIIRGPCLRPLCRVEHLLTPLFAKLPPIHLGLGMTRLDGNFYELEIWSEWHVLRHK